MSSDELKDKALEMIWRIDKERGEDWSNDSYAIADVMVEFYELNSSSYTKDQTIADLRDIVKYYQEKMPRRGSG